MDPIKAKAFFTPPRIRARLRALREKEGKEMAKREQGRGGTSQLRLTPISPDHPSTVIRRSSKTNPDGTKKKQYGPKPVKIVASQED